MPYITQEARDDLAYRQPQNVGELTYILTRIALRAEYYIDKIDDLKSAIRLYTEGKDEKFALYAEVLGALAAAGLEIRRRISATNAVAREARWALENAALAFYRDTVGYYEISKINENGDLKEFQALLASPSTWA